MTAITTQPRDGRGTPPLLIVTLPQPAPEHPRTEGGIAFELVSNYSPVGDQPEAIAGLVERLDAGEHGQALLGVTGSGKTFTAAQVIQRPALVLAPNKTLTPQLYGEMKSFFPNNAVRYFVSYDDRYMPEGRRP